MTENIKDLLIYANGSRHMLETIMKQFNVGEVSDDIALMIRNGSVEKAELFRLITGGLGKEKSHCSAPCLGNNSKIYGLKRS